MPAWRSRRPTSSSRTPSSAIGSRSVERMRIPLSSPELTGRAADKAAARAAAQIGDVAAVNDDKVGGDYPSIACTKDACFLVVARVDKGGAQAALVDPAKGTLLWRKRFAPARRPPGCRDVARRRRRGRLLRGGPRARRVRSRATAWGRRARSRRSRATSRAPGSPRARPRRMARLLARSRSRAHRAIRGSPRNAGTDAERAATPAEPRHRRAGAPGNHPVAEALWASADVTALVAVIARSAPSGGTRRSSDCTFLAATWALVWRHDDARVRRAGLALGGLVIPGTLDPARRVARRRARSAWACGLLSADRRRPLLLRLARAGGAPLHVLSQLARRSTSPTKCCGQLLVIALPEEAFYRGYLQSRLDDVWAPRWHVLGARVGPGAPRRRRHLRARPHRATVPLPTRLAVFFPALLFGWLRARTGGIGASVVLPRRLQRVLVRSRARLRRLLKGRRRARPRAMLRVFELPPLVLDRVVALAHRRRPRARAT